MNVEGNCIKLTYGEIDGFTYYDNGIIWDSNFKYGEISKQRDFSDLESALYWYVELVNKHVSKD
ncbi:MAG: hypothetical protein RR959_06065 [Erysipelotrichaceae bacterium]